MSNNRFYICISFKSNDMLDISLQYKNVYISSINISKKDYSNNDKYLKFKKLYYILNTIDDNDLESGIIHNKIIIKNISNSSFEKIKEKLGTDITDITNKIELIEYINKLIKNNNYNIGGRLTKCNKNNNKRRKTKRLISKI